MRSLFTVHTIVVLLTAAIVGFLLTSFFLDRQGATASPKPQRPVAKPTTVPIADIVTKIDAKRMKGHIAMLASTIGIRQSGTNAEQKAADYVTAQLKSWGYTVYRVPVRMNRRKSSTNIYAELPGQSPKLMLVGAHMDSKSPSPGANDNASGVAVMLELAYLLKDLKPPYTCRFVAFGAEEQIDRRRDHHHYGSRAMAAELASRDMHSMTSLDMVGIGTELRIESQNIIHGKEGWRETLWEIAKRDGLRASYGQGKPLSDHEAFERYGIDVAHVHWVKDSAYHTERDRAQRISGKLLQNTARLMVKGMLSERGNQEVKLRTHTTEKR